MSRADIIIPADNGKPIGINFIMNNLKNKLNNQHFEPNKPGPELPE